MIALYFLNVIGTLWQYHGTGGIGGTFSLIRYVNYNDNITYKVSIFIINQYRNSYNALVY